MPTFHNNRWPLLTTLLEEKGWKRAADGQRADLAFVDDGSWQKEQETKFDGRLKFFSRVFTDLLSNKRSCAIGLKADGCIPLIMPPTFVDLKEWETEVESSKAGADASQPPPLWFWKKMNSSNSKGISVTTDVIGGKQILSLDAAGSNAAAKGVLAKTFDDAFVTRMAEELKCVVVLIVWSLLFFVGWKGGSSHTQFFFFLLFPSFLLSLLLSRF